MKLTLKQIQALDCLLQEFLYQNEIKHKMQLVIKVNSELFTGKFIDYKESKISYMYLNKSKYFINKSIDSVEFINFYEPLNSWNNFYFDEILENIGEGLLITDFAGLHSGANAITGDFSLAAKGFYIKDGKKEYPVDQITVAGNFFKLLKDIEEVGDDLKFPLSSVGSPTVIASGLSVAGK